MKKTLSAILAFTLFSGVSSFACTNLLVGRNASADGSTMVTYSMDMYGYCAKLRIVPATAHQPSEKAQVINYETGQVLGEIPQAPFTHGVVGYINDRQVSITETTWGGREGQVNPDGIMHYSSLIQLALERASTAREAIGVMADLVAEYGYASTGESFSIGDPDEVWILDMIGKGEEKGAVWVAVRIPDDCISAHANQTRIHKFSRHDKDNVLFSKDVISYARKKGFFSGKDDEFDFAKAYSPATFGTQRHCEARVWSIFNRFSAGAEAYIKTVDGLHPELSADLPLYVKPDRKLTLEDAIEAMRDHYEGTPFDMTDDISAGPWKTPYRPGGLSYQAEGLPYFNERPISTQQSACVELYQMRCSLPDAIGGVLWFANDDAAMVTYTPVYCSATRLPLCYNDPDASDTDFSWNSAFWVCNWVSNMVYPRYSALYPELSKTRDALQAKVISGSREAEARAASLPADQAAELLTAYGESTAGEMMQTWKDLGMKLVVKFNDMVIKPEKDGRFETTPEGHGVRVQREGYGEQYRNAIAEMTGSRYYKGEMTFVQISDTQIGFVDDTKHYRMTDSLMNVAINAINAIHPACVILTGDLVNDIRNEEQVEIYKRIIARLDPSVPLHIVPGNHDIKGFKSENYKRYMELVGYDRFSFKKGDCAFIGFDSCRIKEDAADAEEEQFAWLEAELKKAAGSRHIFLFCHCPVVMESLGEKDGHNNFPIGKRERYLSLFKKYGVEAVFSGHSHVSGYFEADGIRHVNSIPVCSGFGKGFPGINVVKVTPDGFTYEFRRGINAD